MQAIQLTCAARPARIAALCGRRLPVSATRLQQQYRQCSRRIRSRDACVVRASEDEASTEDPSTDASDPSVSVMGMADSLVERANEVATSGLVDEAFQISFVPELKAELEVLSTRAREAEAAASSMEEALQAARDKLLRLTAEFDNFRKRTAAEKDATRATVRGDTVMQLVPLVDNFELARSSIKVESEGEKRVDAAYQSLYKQMVELFRGLGVEAVPGAGEPFDPEVHEAIMREPSDDVPDGTVLEEFRKGFRLGDRLLRPAMVKVSFRDGPAVEAEPQEVEASATSD